MYDATDVTGDEQEQARAGDYREQGFSGFGSFQDILNDFEQMFTGQAGSAKQPTQGEDINISVTLPFMNAVKGGQVQVVLERRTVCPTCQGTKVKPGTSPTKCTHCGGLGVFYFQQGPVTFQSPCQNCKGTGTVIRHYCPTCHGSGITNAHVTELINIPAGVDTGMILRVMGKGHSVGLPGSLVVKVTVQSHPVFRREGFDLYTTVQIPLSQAALGGAVQVDTLEGKLSMKLDSGEDFRVPKRLPGKGVPHLPPDNQRCGDLFVQVQLQVPHSLTLKQRMLFEELAKEDPNK